MTYLLGQSIDIHSCCWNFVRIGSADCEVGKTKLHYANFHMCEGHVSELLFWVISRQTIFLLGLPPPLPFCREYTFL